MSRLFNDPTDFKDELIAGFVAAYGRYVERIPEASGVMIQGGPVKGRVSVLLGGGSGHYPLFCGLVGPGFGTGAVMGDIFASPSGEQVYRCTRALDGGAGVVLGYGNYSGDVMNFGMGQMRASMEGIDVRQVLVTDDVASSPNVDERRGVAGDFFVFKALGASAWRGDPLDTVEAYGLHANKMCRSFGVAFAGCTLPGQEHPLFTVDPDKMELGMGLHGEPGVETAESMPARELARLMAERVLNDAPSGAGERATVLVNGLGSTPYEELFVLYGAISQSLTNAGLELYRPLVGEFGTSLNMDGCSLTVMWLDDDLKALLDARCDTPTYTQGEGGRS